MTKDWRTTGDARTPAEVWPPGEYIKDEIDARGIDHDTFAQLIPMSEIKFQELLGGKRKLILSVALRIAQLLGTSHDVWLNLESAWRSYCRKQESFHV